MKYRVTCKHLGLVLAIEGNPPYVDQGAVIDESQLLESEIPALLEMGAIVPATDPEVDHVEFEAEHVPTRAELNARAAELGIEKPEKLRNIAAVQAAIAEAEAILAGQDEYPELADDDDQAQGQDDDPDAVSEDKSFS